MSEKSGKIKLIPYQSLVAAGPYLHIKNYFMGEDFGSETTEGIGSFALYDAIDEMVSGQRVKEEKVLKTVFDALKDTYSKSKPANEATSNLQSIALDILDFGSKASSIEQQLLYFNQFLTFTREANNQQAKITNNKYSTEANKAIQKAFDGLTPEAATTLASLKDDSLDKVITALKSLISQITDLKKDESFGSIPSYQQTIDAIIRKVKGFYVYCLNKKGVTEDVGEFKAWKGYGSAKDAKGNRKLYDNYTVADAFLSMRRSGSGYMKNYDGNIMEKFLRETLNLASGAFRGGVITTSGTTLVASRTGDKYQKVGNYSTKIKQDIVFGITIKSDYYKQNSNEINEISSAETVFKPLMKISVKKGLRGNKLIDIHNGGSLESYMNHIEQYSSANGKIGSGFRKLGNALGSSSFQYHYVNQMAQGHGPIIEATKNMIREMGYLLIGVNLQDTIDNSSSVDFYSDGYKIYPISYYLQNLLDKQLSSAVEVNTTLGDASKQKASKKSAINNPPFKDRPHTAYYATDFITMGTKYGKPILGMGKYQLSARLVF